MTILTGDSRVILATMQENSVDSVVTDPPYGLEFMGQEWDRPWAVSASASVGFAGRENNLTLPAHRDNRNANCRACGGRQRGKKRCTCVTPEWDRHPRQDMVAFQQWTEDWAREALRVLKPGGHLLSFGGTRTYHRMVSGLEDAGFEIRDCVMWLYGTGFPKSLNISKALDADAAKQWEGWGTALKPAYEPIIVARKPLDGTVAQNVLKHRTGGLNIDASRITYVSDADKASATPQGECTNKESESIAAKPDAGRGLERVTFERPEQKGRWPANVILDEEAGELLDAQSGPTGAASPVLGTEPSNVTKNVFGERGRVKGAFHADVGGASRFFYCAKASRAEREKGCESLPQRTAGEVTGGREEGSDGLNSPRAGAGRTSGARNFHPTVKPVALMRYLVRLVTPPGGVVLDPFMGSGSTGVAALAEGFAFIGIELDPAYAEIAQARIGVEPEPVIPDPEPQLPVDDDELANRWL